MSKNIFQVIKNGEGLTTEFKRAIDHPFKIAKTIVSFANTSGGNLIIGVGDDQAIVGVESELNELKRLEMSLAMIEPKILIRLKSEKLESKQILIVEVEESNDKPHFVLSEKGERYIYIRMKDKSIPIPRLLLYHDGDKEIDKLLANRHVKTLIAYLKETDRITAKVFSRIINISEKRADRMLQDLAAKQILLKMSTGKPETFSLKWAD